MVINSANVNKTNNHRLSPLDSTAHKKDHVIYDVENPGPSGLGRAQKGGGVTPDNGVIILKKAYLCYCLGMVQVHD
jgi:hypothetical protein